jgi:hypothetical protein
LNADVTTAQDIQGLRDYNARTKGYTPASHELWLDHRPDVFKRKMLTIYTADLDTTRPYQAQNLLAVLHYYAVTGYGEGILYEMRQALGAGVTKGQVLDTLAVAYIHAHAHGMNVVAASAADFLASAPWPSDADPNAFPPEWSFDPDAFASGLDFSTPDLSDRERRLLDDWYMERVGEIPRYVTFLGMHRPALLKAHRNRFEHALQGGLPREMMAYLLLYFNVIRGFGDGIREAVLLARMLGMKKMYVVGAICRAMTSYGGPDAVSIAAAAAGDLVDSMEA